MTDATVWAGAARCPTPRAKGALVTLAAFADQEGYAWATIEVLMVGIQTDIERTAQRGLADLKGRSNPELGPGLWMENGERPLIEETPRSRWTVHRGKLIPVYRLVLERGPRNMRERLIEDAEARRAALGVTCMSPQDEPSGDPGVTPGGDLGVGLGVTPETRLYLKGQNRTEEKSTTGGRARDDVAIRADFDRAYAGYHPSGTRGRSAREGEAWPAWLAAIAVLAVRLELAEGEASERLSAACVAAGRDKALLGTSGVAKAFHDFLTLGRYDAWLGAAAGPALAVTRAPFACAEIRAAVVAHPQAGETWARSWLDRCGLDPSVPAILPPTETIRDRITKTIGPLLRQRGVTLGAVCAVPSPPPAQDR